MLFFVIWPLILVGIVVTISSVKAEQKKRAEAQKHAEQAQTAQPVSEGQTSYRPVRPSVQIPTVRKEPPAPRPASVQQAYQSPFADKIQHPEHDLCALRAEEPNKPEAAHPQAAAVPVLQSGGLNLTPDSIVSGVLFSEIFGKPKALR